MVSVTPKKKMNLSEKVLNREFLLISLAYNFQNHLKSINFYIRASQNEPKDSQIRNFPLSKNKNKNS